jgi:uncharacterized protein
MKTPDVNVLLHAVNQDSAQHSAARTWIEGALAGTAAVGFSWAALLGFLRLSTRTGIFARPLPIEGALRVVDAWLHHPSAQLLTPSDGHAAVLARLLIGAGRGGSLVSDAHLAALAIEHNAELATFDRDFERFAGLRWTLLK